MVYKWNTISPNFTWNEPIYSQFQAYQKINIIFYSDSSQNDDHSYKTYRLWCLQTDVRLVMVIVRKWIEEQSSHTGQGFRSYPQKIHKSVFLQPRDGEIFGQTELGKKVFKKENIEFKPTVFCLKMDFVSHSDNGNW